jgi:hypothetical protein
MRRKIPVHYRMVEATLDDRKRDLTAVGSFSRLSNHPLLVARYEQLLAEEVQGSKQNESDKDPGPSRHRDQPDGEKGKMTPIGQSVSPETDRPLPIQRQPGLASTEPAAALPAHRGSTAFSIPEIPAVGAPRRTWEGAVAESFTPHRYKDDSGPLNDVHIGSDHKVKADDIADRIRTHMPRRFDTRFVEFYTEKDEAFRKAVELVKGDDTTTPLCKDYLKAVQKGAASRTLENQSSRLCTLAFNAIAERLVPGHSRAEFFSSSSTEYPSWNPDLKVGEGHGERPIKPSDMDQWHKVAPDVAVWKHRTSPFQGKQDPDYHWGKIACTGEMKVESFCDMRTEGDTTETSALQILKYLVSYHLHVVYIQQR